MPTKAAQQFTAWSYSRYNDYKKCPLAAKLKHLDRIQSPAGPALARGSQIHKDAEDFANKKIKTLPDSLKLFKGEFKAIQKFSLEVESQWAMNAKWAKTGWFDPDAWCRIVVDAAHAVDKQRFKVIDYKTGKVYEENKEQLSLYALGAFARSPTAEVVEAELWYLDRGELISQTFERKDQKKLQTYWIKETKPMLNDTIFAPRPGDHCRYCMHSEAKGGICKF
jgi:hypothetical protein